MKIFLLVPLVLSSNAVASNLDKALDCSNFYEVFNENVNPPIRMSNLITLMHTSVEYEAETKLCEVELIYKVSDQYFFYNYDQADELAQDERTIRWWNSDFGKYILENDFRKIANDGVIYNFIKTLNTDTQINFNYYFDGLQYPDTQFKIKQFKSVNL